MLADSASPSLTRIAKKLHARDKIVPDEAIQSVIANPQIVEKKKGDHTGVFVYKFNLNSQETLLAYELRPHKTEPTQVLLMALGPQGSSYATLKR